MYICLSCGATFDDPRRFAESHGFEEGPREIFCLCPSCGDGGFEEATFCHQCDTLIPASYERDRYGLCEPCENSALQRFRDCLAMFTPREIKYINDFYEGRDLVEEWRNL